MFHVPNDLVKRRTSHFRVRTLMADLQFPGTTPKPLEGLFLQLFIHTLEKVTKYGKSEAKVRPLSCDRHSDDEYTCRPVCQAVTRLARGMSVGSLIADC